MSQRPGRRKRGRKNGRNRRGPKPRKSRAVLDAEAEARDVQLKAVPRCLVFVRSQRSVGPMLKQLVQDLRHVFLPYTPANVKIPQRAPIHKLLDIAKSAFVSHFAVISLTERAPHLKLLRVPVGPTVHCQIVDYSLAKDVQDFYGKVGLKYEGNRFVRQKGRKPCLALFEGFNGTVDWQTLTRASLQHAFPNPEDVNGPLASIPGDIQRVAMFTFDANTGLIQFRHYSVQFSDPAADAEDEEIDAEEAGEAAAAPADASSAVRKVGLSELGPRLTLRVEKIVDGLFEGGEVLYHVRETRTAAEADATRQRHAARKKLKADRRRIQNDNVEAKREKKREKKLQRRKRWAERQAALAGEAAPTEEPTSVEIGGGKRRRLDGKAPQSAGDALKRPQRKRKRMQ